MEGREPSISAVVVADAPTADLRPYLDLMQGADLRIAADGGARHFIELGLLPHLAIGDFDSLPPALLVKLEDHDVEIDRHPAQKDEPALELPLPRAPQRGARRIIVLAALGGRPDMHLANL